MENKVLKFKVNMINQDVLEQLKKLEKDGYITQVIDENNDIEVGDTRFFIYKGFRNRKEVVELVLHKVTMKSTGKYYTFEGKIRGYNQTLTFRDSSFGKKVFLTQEDAESSIK